MLDENITGGLLNESITLVDNTEERVTTIHISHLQPRSQTMGGRLNCGQDVELRTLNFELTKLMRDSANLGLVPRRFFWQIEKSDLRDYG